jgi:putative membrane-bound dehydrogenase-like protein
MHTREVFLPRALLFLPLASAAAGDFSFGDTKLTVPEGFTVERAITSSLVERPIEVDFDEQGRLYVTEASGTNDKVDKQLADKPHRVLRLVDSDRDGIFDQRTVFADGLMLPEGCMWLDGSLYIAAPPQIWKLTDTNDDGIADQREVWFDGKTLTGCANDLHGPYRGPDGWIYWCKGAFAEQTYKLADGRDFKTRASHVFRRRPEGGPVEPVITGGMDNPVGLAWTRSGELILSCTFFMHPAGGQRDGLIHAIYGSVYGKPHNVLDGHPRTTPNLSPVMTHLGAAAPCGIARAESEALGFRDQLFACSFNLHKVSRHELIAKGGTFTTQDYDFLTSDSTDFHPTDVIEDRDGSLLVVDTGGWYKLCCPTSQLHKPDVLGAIYRIRKSGARQDLQAPSRPNPFTLASLHDSDETRQHAAVHAVALSRDRGALQDVARLLRSPSAQIRRVAAEALGRLDDDAAVSPLLEAVSRESDPAVLHSATYALLELRRPEPLKKALASEEFQVQRAALIALAQMPEADPAPVFKRLFETNETLADTTAWLASLRPEWRNEAAKRLIARAIDSAGKITPAMRRVLDGATLDSSAVESACQRAGEVPGKLELLFETLSSVRLEKLPANVIASLRATMETSSSDVRRTAVGFLLKHGRLIEKELARKWLRTAANDNNETASLRTTAFRALPPGTKLEEGEAAYLRSIAQDPEKHPDRAAAIQSLAQAALTSAQVAKLIDLIPALNATELSALLPALFSVNEPSLSERIVADLREAPAFRSVPLDVIDRALKKLPEELRKSAMKAIERTTLSTAEQRSRLDELASHLSHGDIRRGQALFNSPRSACTTCHAMGYLGGTLGPDLTRIGQIRTERDLLEAIVYPSASFVRSYEPAHLKTSSGEMLGIVRGETNDEITLAIAPGAETRVARREIQSMQPATISLMPQGYDGIFKPAELADLVAFLKSLR